MRKFKESGFFVGGGFFAIVDGQFGSTGKGLLSSVLAEQFPNQIALVTSNAGPNSGHTSYYGDEKIVLQQLPTFAVMHKKFHGKMPDVYMNAGAIIEPSILDDEVKKYAGHMDRVFLNRRAALVREEGQKQEKSGIVSAIGSTGKGTGAALASKVMRDPGAVVDAHYRDDLNHDGKLRLTRTNHAIDALERGHKVLAEVSQGFSLSLNAAPFYPYCTSRDCTVMQAMSDAGVHPRYYRDCAMVVRTFPIRVAGTSGPGYSDQVETTWEAVGQTPEITTVTKKVRRIFTWSEQQYIAALLHNRPGVVMVNFMNYLNPGKVDREEWVRDKILRPYVNVMRQMPKAVLLGFGPCNSDVVEF